MSCVENINQGLPCTPLDFSFNSANNQITTTGYTYDAAGNLLSDNTHGYVYDAENRLTCILGTDGTCTSATATLYLYDAQGQRVGKQQANTLEDYVYDPQGHISSVHDGLTNLLRTELYAGGRHVATWTPNPNGQYSDPYPSGLFYNHTDWLGTERVRTTSSGTIYEKCTDTPYGMNLLCVGPDTSPMHFTGKQHDYESGLDNFGARYYGSSNALGRFMSPDPGPYVWSDPQTLNRYAYTRNNPLKYVDPLGKYFVVSAQDQKFYQKALSDIYRRPGGRDLVNSLAKSSRPVLLDRGELNTKETGKAGVSSALLIKGQAGVQGVHTTIGTNADLLEAAQKAPGKEGASISTAHELEHDEAGLSKGQSDNAAGVAAMAAGDAPSSPGGNDTLGGTAQAGAEEIMGEKPDMSGEDSNAAVQAILQAGQQQWQDSTTRSDICSQNTEACH
jgi:RHS repeat-associated protein